MRRSNTCRVQSGVDSNPLPANAKAAYSVLHSAGESLAALHDAGNSADTIWHTSKELDEPILAKWHNSPQPLCDMATGILLKIE